MYRAFKKDVEKEDYAYQDKKQIVAWLETLLI